MNVILTRLSTCATVSLSIASLCLMVNCHKPQSQLSNTPAAVAELHPSSANATPNGPAGEAGAPTEPAEPLNASTSAPARRRRSKPSQSFARRVEPATEQVMASEQRILAFASVRPAFAQPRPPDPADLIAQASQQLRRGAGQEALSDGWNASSNAGASYCRIAANTAERAIQLLKAEQVPTEPAAKLKYEALLLTGLSIRAEALALVAADVDRTQAGAAEAAFREYLEAEPDATKQVNAEHKLAEMFYNLKELEKAKTTYQKLLAHNADDKRALAAMAVIYRDIAAAQNVAGEKADADTSYKLAKSYSDRLRDLTPEGKADVDVSEREIKAKSADVNIDKRVEKMVPTEKRVEPVRTMKRP